MPQLSYEQIAGAVQSLPLLEKQRLLELLLTPSATTAQEQANQIACEPITPQPLKISPNLSWLDAHRAEYAGQWVALHNGQLIAHSNDGEALVAPVRQSGVSNPLIVFVEQPDTELFIGF